jgi:2,3-dihydroxybenzoate-AMP ligase
MIPGATSYPQEFAERYRRSGLWRDQTLGELLQHSAQVFGDRIAVAGSERTLTHHGLNSLSSRLAGQLLHEGLRPGDIVLMQLPNVWEFYVVFFALAKIGVLPVMCLPPHRNTELAYFAKLTQAKGYFVAPSFRNFDYLAMARELQAECPHLTTVVATGRGSGKGVRYLMPMLEQPADEPDSAARLAAIRPDPFDVAFFLLSGGTTGIPKLIPRTHADYIYNARQAASVLEWDATTVFLVVIPAAHNFPLGAPGMVGAVSLGGSIALSLLPDPDSVFATIERHRGTFLAVSPALLINLLNSPAREKYDLSSLRFICAGGQKMLPELVDRTLVAWPSVKVGHAFGMAEGLLNLTRPHDPPDVIRETQGRPVAPDDEIRVVDDSGSEVRPGEPGELLARGPYTIRGYYKAAEHNRSAFTADGFYRTGDIVRMHPSGNLVVEGRKKDLINRGGEKISAEEIENLILSHDSVHMAAVVAMPDPVMGEKACAFVIPKSGKSLTLDQLCAFLVERKIARFKLPERLELVESFPLTSVGKVSKKDLRERIAKALSEELVNK